MTDNSLPIYLFHQGTNFYAYRFLGCHKGKSGRKNGYFFRVWAPDAKEVSLVGSFADWEKGIPMSKLNDEGIWEAFSSSAKEGDGYKFRIEAQNGNVFMKSDPYAFFSELRPDTASIIYDYNGNYKWTDDKWRHEAEARDDKKRPMNIYEVHFGSWKKGCDGKFLSYREIADRLVPYLVEMNYTHVEVMPLAEHPLDESWGYQVTGYFSPTSRYGDPVGLKYFVDKCHENNIGVILDWVPAHFCKNENGLYMFDGQPLYESGIECRREHKSWGTGIFDYARNEVACFLISNAIYWLNEYHIDGLRVDAVASMLYLDYDRQGQEWLPNIYGGNHNLEAIEFFRKLSIAVKEHTAGGYLIAEESTSFAGVTKSPVEGGLGFDFKWNMGWMNDTLSYVETDPYFRSYAHNKLTFSMMYAYSENYILPFSHDEVVHLKKSMLDKIPGEYDYKFAGLRTLFAYMMGHPGKKLNFMGSEIGQFAEWNEKSEIDWFLLDYERHRQLWQFVKELNALYKEYPEFYQNDCDWNGFEWLTVDDSSNNVLVFERKAGRNRSLVFVLNFSGITCLDYCIGIESGKLSLLLDSDEKRFGGKGLLEKQKAVIIDIPMKNKPATMSVTVPAASAGIYLLEYGDKQ